MAIQPSFRSWEERNVKDLKNILTMLVIFIIAATTSFAANTIVVKTGDIVKTTVTSLTEALTAATAGDTIDITAYDTQIDGGNGFHLKGVNLVCSAATPAVIKFTGDASGGLADHFVFLSNGVTLRNLKLLAPDTMPVDKNLGGVIGYGTITIDQCTIANFTKAEALFAGHTDPGYLAELGTDYAGPLNLTVTNSYLVNSLVGLQFTCGFSAPAAKVDPRIMIDHCTIASKVAGGWPVSFMDAWFINGNTIDQLTLKNSLLYGYRLCWPLVYLNNYEETAPGNPDATPPVPATYRYFFNVGMMTHSYNAFMNSWENHAVSYLIDDGNGGVKWFEQFVPGTGDLMINGAWNGECKDPFKDQANGDYRLNKYSRLNGNGENDSNIGADQTNNGKVTYDTFIVRADGKGDYTDLQSALYGAQAGDQVIIEQGDKWMRTGNSFYIDRGQKLIGGLVDASGKLTGQKPVLSSDQGRTINLANGSTIDGVKVVPTKTGQAGIAAQDTFRITNCEVSNFSYAGIELFALTAKNPGNLLTGSVDHCVIVNNHLAFEFYQNDAASAAVVGDVVIDHCTFDMQNVDANVSGHSIDFTASFTGKFDASKVTIKNNIFRQAKWSLAGHIHFDQVAQPTGLKVSYNDYIATDAGSATIRSSWNTRNDSGWKVDGPLALGTGEVENKDPKFMPNYWLNKGSEVAALDETGKAMGAFEYKDGLSAAKGWTIYN